MSVTEHPKVHVEPYPNGLELKTFFGLSQFVNLLGVHILCRYNVNDTTLSPIVK